MWHDSRDLIIATFSKRTWKISYIINMFSFSFTHYTISYLGKKWFSWKQRGDSKRYYKFTVMICSLCYIYVILHDSLLLKLLFSLISFSDRHLWHQLIWQNFLEEISHFTSMAGSFLLGTDRSPVSQSDISWRSHCGCILLPFLFTMVNFPSRTCYPSKPQF